MERLELKTFSMPVSCISSVNIPCALCGGSVFKPFLNCGDFYFVKCINCALVQRNPQPLQQEITARYAKIYGNEYLLYELENEESFLKLQQLALKDAGFFRLEKRLFPGVSANTASQEAIRPCVLDIGCATGSLLASLHERKWRVTGVEISPCADYAKKVRNLDVRSEKLEDNNFPDKSFDVVLASHLIEHLNDPKTFLAEIHRILKDEGYCFITTPNISGFQARLFKNRWRSAIFDHLYLFSAVTLKKLLRNTGFKIESIHTWGGLAAGSAPKWLKKSADFLVKYFGCGDVMIVRAKKSFC
ncbi:MAG: class I SAM-dependent methyltransferase [Treponema sp.]|nr:class I SAM-dependent methyltransferase [Treponema sp.]